MKRRKQVRQSVAISAVLMLLLFLLPLAVIVPFGRSCSTGRKP